MILEFAGVYKNARVLINGVEAGGALYGYLPFFINLDGLLKDGENTITVTCTAENGDSRTYTFKITREEAPETSEETEKPTE